jgi:hypothetical protein
VDLDEDTAIHEAAHAVAALQVGLTLSDITAGIDEWGIRGSTGLALPSDYVPSKYPELARKQAVVSLAGPIVEIRSRGDLDFTGALGDIDTLLEYLSSSSEDGDLSDVAACEAEARSIVEENWPGIVRVADALRRSAYGRIEGSTVVDLLAVEPGP